MDFQEFNVGNRNSFLTQDQKYDFIYLLRGAKAEVLSPFIQDIISILMREGFSLQEILESLAQYMDTRPQLQSAANYVDLAAEAIGKIEREANLTEEPNEAI